MVVQYMVRLKFLQLTVDEGCLERFFVTAVRWRLVVLVRLHSVQLFNLPGELRPELRRVHIDALICLDWAGGIFISRRRVVVFEKFARRGMQHVILSMQYFHVLDMT